MGGPRKPREPPQPPPVRSENFLSCPFLAPPPSAPRPPPPSPPLDPRPPTARPGQGAGRHAAGAPTRSAGAGRGVYLLSLLPESDVNRIVEYSAGTGKKSFAALLPENAYGNVVEAAFKQAVGRRGGRIVAFEKYGADRATAARNVAQALGQADALFIADDGDSVVSMADALTAAGANLKNIQLLGTGLWDNPRVYASPALQGGLYAAPDPSGFRSFSARYPAKFA